MGKPDQLIDAILKAADGEQGSDGRKRLACATAFALAKRFGTEIIEIGRICNENNIRICKCQLDCFK